MENFLLELRKLLGLAEDADEQAVLAKLRELLTVKQSALPDPAKFVPIGDFERVVGEVNKLNQGISLHAATDHVESQIANGKLPPYLKDWGIALCNSNKPAFDTFVDRTKGAYAHLFKESAAKNRIRDGSDGSQLTEEEKDAARRLGLTDEEFLKGKPAH